MIYKFKNGKSIHGVDAQTVGDTLERIRRRHGGRLRPEDVVEAAESADSPLHQIFTWDDSKAAHAYRLSEARSLLRVVMRVSDDGDVTQQYYNVKAAVRVAESDADDGGSPEQYYQSVEVLKTSPTEYASAESLALGYLAAAERSLEGLRNIAPKGRKIKARRAADHVRRAQAELT